MPLVLCPLFLVRSPNFTEEGGNFYLQWKHFAPGWNDVHVTGLAAERRRINRYFHLPTSSFSNK